VFYSKNVLFSDVLMSDVRFSIMLSTMCSKMCSRRCAQNVLLVDALKNVLSTMFSKMCCSKILWALRLEVNPHRCVFHDTRPSTDDFLCFYALGSGRGLAPRPLIGWHARVTRHLIIDFFAAMTARGNVTSADF